MTNSSPVKIRILMRSGSAICVRRPSDIADALERDRRFFEDNPNRLHRLRWATVGEIDEELPPHESACPVGHRPAVAVKKVSGNIRVRSYLYWPTIENIDVDDERARQIFETHVPVATKRMMDRLANEISIRHG
ncbi:MAG: hypothetical protein WBA44_01055 [Mesorhizobium sp.]